MLFWIIHSLDLLDYPIKDYTESYTHEFILYIIKRIIETIFQCQSPTGGFGGGPSQLSHLATTYAALSVISILDSENAYKMINIDLLYSWIVSLKQPDGSFIMHIGGEIDVRYVGITYQFN